MNTILHSKPNACPKCNGTGRLGYRRSNGVCFRCNGAGLVPSKEAAGLAEVLRQNAAHRKQTQVAPAAMPPVENSDWLFQLFATDGAAQPS